MGMRVWYGKGEKESRARSLLSLSTKHQKCRRTLSAYFYLRVQHPKAGQKGERRSHFRAYIRFIASSRAASHLYFSAAGKSAEETVELLCAFLNRPVGTTALAQLLPWDSTRPKMYTPQPVWNCISGLGWLPMSFWASALWIVESIDCDIRKSTLSI